MSADEGDDSVLRKRRRFVVGENGVTEINTGESSDSMGAGGHAVFTNRKTTNKTRQSRQDSKDRSKQIKLRVAEWPNDCLAETDGVLTCTACVISLSCHKSHVKDHVESRRHCELVAKQKFIGIPNVPPEAAGIVYSQPVTALNRVRVQGGCSASVAAAIVSAVEIGRNQSSALPSSGLGATAPMPISATTLRDFITTQLPLQTIKMLLNISPLHPFVPSRGGIKGALRVTDHDLFESLHGIKVEEHNKIKAIVDGRSVALLVAVTESSLVIDNDVSSLFADYGDNSMSSQGRAVPGKHAKVPEGLDHCAVVVVVRWADDKFDIQHRLLHISLHVNIPSPIELTNILAHQLEMIRNPIRNSRSWTLPSTMVITLRAPSVFWRSKNTLVQTESNPASMHSQLAAGATNMPGLNQQLGANPSTARSQICSVMLAVKSSIGDTIVPTFSSIPTMLQQCTKYFVANCLQSFWTDLTVLLQDSAVARKQWNRLFQFPLNASYGDIEGDSIDSGRIGASLPVLCFLTLQFSQHRNKLLVFVTSVEEYIALDPQPVVAARIAALGKWIRDPGLYLWLTVELRVVSAISTKLHLMAEALSIETIPSSVHVADIIDVVTAIFWSEAAVPLAPNRQLHVNLPELRVIVNDAVDALSNTMGGPYFNNALLAKEEVYSRLRHMVYPVSEYLFRSLGGLHVIESSTYKLARLINPFSICRMQSLATKRDEVLNLFHNMPVFAKSLGVFADYIVDAMQGELDTYAIIINSSGGYRRDAFEWLAAERTAIYFELGKGGVGKGIKDSSWFCEANRVLDSEARAVSKFWFENENRLPNLSRLTRFVLSASPSAALAGDVLQSSMQEFRLQGLTSFASPWARTLQSIACNSQASTATAMIHDRQSNGADTNVAGNHFSSSINTVDHPSVIDASIPVDASDIANGDTGFDVDTFDNFLRAETSHVEVIDCEPVGDVPASPRDTNKSVELIMPVTIGAIQQALSTESSGGLSLSTVPASSTESTVVSNRSIGFLHESRDLFIEERKLLSRYIETQVMVLCNDSWKQD